MAVKPSPLAVRLLPPRADAVPAGRARAPRTPFRVPPGDAGQQLVITPDDDEVSDEPGTGDAADAAPHDADVPPVVVPAGPPLSHRIARACARDERTSLRMARLAAVIGDFVNTPAVADSGCWELQITLDPALLPATRLRLSLSSWRLSLRFESNDRDARCVILENSRELQHRLQDLLPAHIDIDIVCW
jgi:type III secretion control protein HpaP